MTNDFDTNKNNEEIIYLDNAATTKVRREVFEAMRPFLTDEYANPSSIYKSARASRKEIEKSRETVSAFLGARTEEIFFTSGGSESDNWALVASAVAFKEKGRHIITSKSEHPAVLNTCKYLEALGFEISYIDVDEFGQIKINELEAAIRKDTILISVMFANNEIGTIQPIAQIGEIAKRRGIYFHTDAVQAFGHERINVDEMNIDMLSASGHKFGGPKGVGILYIRNSVRIGSLIHGGSQERGRRAGTYNTPGIVGFGKATELSSKELETSRDKERELRDYLISRIKREIPDVVLNGHPSMRLSNNANFSISGISGESLLILLDQKNICASSGSACTSGSLEPSHVLLAIGRSDIEAEGELRLTLSADTTRTEIDIAVNAIKESVSRLRA